MLVDGNSFFSPFFFTLWKSIVFNCFITDILQNIFCVQQRKETHTGLEELWGEEMMTEFYFWG